MDLVLLVVVAAVVGFLVWWVTTRVPMPAGWATAIKVIAILVLALWALSHVIVIPNVLPARPYRP